MPSMTTMAIKSKLETGSNHDNLQIAAMTPNLFKMGQNHTKSHKITQNHTISPSNHCQDLKSLHTVIKMAHTLTISPQNHWKLSVRTWNYLAYTRPYTCSNCVCYQRRSNIKCQFIQWLGSICSWTIQWDRRYKNIWDWDWWSMLSYKSMY